MAADTEPEPIVAEPLVVDASVAVKAALVEDGFLVLADRRLHAPTLLWSEVASALSQLLWRREISHEEAADAIDRLLAAPLTVHASSEIVKEALDLARRLGWPKSYDAEYVVLARSLEADLMTLDARLARGAADQVRVVPPTRDASGG